MVKNISNPLNARKVAKILSGDANKQGYEIKEREITVFLSDNRISDFKTAFKQLKQEELLSEDFSISDQALNSLKEANFIDDNYKTVEGGDSIETSEIYNLDDMAINSMEFKTQLESLKNKLLKSRSGGLNIEGHTLDNFERKFGRPMKYFKASMEKRGYDLSDLKAFTVIYATDHLSLGDNSKQDVYQLIFGRYDEIKSELEDILGFSYEWPNVSGTSFIELGKKYTITSELAEFAKQFRSISGLDTYPEKAIQVFFVELVSGELFEEMISKNILFRWSEGKDHDDPRQWLIPPPKYSLDHNVREILYHASIAHIIFTRIEADNPSLLDIIEDIKDLNSQSRIIYLAKRLEATLTRKSISLQFGTTISNCFENFKTNPSKISPFLNSTIKFFKKSENIEVIIQTLNHNIKTGMKNSTGILKKYLQEVSNEELSSAISENIRVAIKIAVENLDLPNKNPISEDEDIDMTLLDHNLRTLDDKRLKEFFSLIFDQVFILTNRYTRNLAPERQEPIDKSGGLSELTQDFLSTVNYHGTKNTNTKTYIEEIIDLGVDKIIATRIAHICSYITYQVASKEGRNGELMLSDLISFYRDKIIELGDFELKNGEKLRDHESFLDFVTHDLQQAHALVSLASKVKTDAYNAWTPLNDSTGKHAVYINRFLLPNMFYWQRIPKSLISILLSDEVIERDRIKEIVKITNRFSLREPYSLLCMGAKAEINTFEEAEIFLKNVFSLENIDGNFRLKAKTGEAEITQETVYLWNKLQEEF